MLEPAEDGGNVEKKINVALNVLMDEQSFSDPAGPVAGGILRKNAINHHPHRKRNRDLLSFFTLAAYFGAEVPNRSLNLFKGFSQFAFRVLGSPLDDGRQRDRVSVISLECPPLFDGVARYVFRISFAPFRPELEPSLPPSKT